MSDNYSSGFDSGSKHQYQRPASKNQIKNGKVVAVYPYTDEAGEPLYEVVRYKPKSFAYRRPDGNGGYIYNLNGCRRVLYNLPEVVREKDFVFVVEGEKDVENARKAFGFTFTTNPMGAGKWRDEYSEFFRGEDVSIIPDNDESGLRHAQEVAQSVYPLAKTVRMVEIARGLNKKCDISDWIQNGGTLERFIKLVSKAPIWKPEVEESESENGLVLLSDVEPEKIRWLWHGYMARGALTIIDGDPGLGKSTLALDIAARVSQGDDMPDESSIKAKGGVVILTAEDGLATVVRPRLELAGADLTRIVALTGVRRRDRDTGQWFLAHPTLQDLKALRQATEKVEAKLVIVDPLMSYLISDAHKDQKVRQELAPLVQLAEEEQTAVVTIRHFKKDRKETSGVYRGGGSIGIIGAARSGFLVSKDPSDDSRKIMAPTKANLSQLPKSLAYKIVANKEDVIRVEWIGKCDYTAGQLLSAAAGHEDRGKEDEAKEFLADLLSKDPLPFEKVLEEARKVGISQRTLERAKSALNVKSEKTGFGDTGEWVWNLKRS